MSHGENVDVKYIDTEYSSGDSKNMKSKQYREENNNEIDELSKDFSEMGCIVGVAKRPPNICIETCVYESEDEKSQTYGEEDGYSDEFEDDKSEEQDAKSVTTESKTAANDVIDDDLLSKSSMKLSKSQSCMSSKAPGSTCGRSTSGRSTSFGSVSVPSTRRVNMSFTNERLREIERHNHILLTKILSARNTRKSSIPPREQPPRRPVPSAAVSRKNQQRQIDHDNMVRVTNQTRLLRIDGVGKGCEGVGINLRDVITCKIIKTSLSQPQF